ncbi:MAG: hypothetical protein MR286_02180 [Clostridiales bacterium]|nr:hypothetical protein [Clostridiales bacterium]
MAQYYSTKAEDPQEDFFYIGIDAINFTKKPAPSILTSAKSLAAARDAIPVWVGACSPSLLPSRQPAVLFWAGGTPLIIPRPGPTFPVSFFKQKAAVVRTAAFCCQDFQDMVVLIHLQETIRARNLLVRDKGSLFYIFLDIFYNKGQIRVVFFILFFGSPGRAEGGS